MTGFCLRRKEVKKLRKQKNLKLIAATGVTIFSLFAAVTGAFAWFTSLLDFKNSVDGFNVFHDDSQVTTVSCYAIKYDGIYGGRAVEITDGSQRVKMSEYDNIFRDKNINTPLFLRIEIGGFDSSKDLQINIPCTGSYYVENQSYIANKLSNVACAKFAYGLKINGSDVPDTYTLSGDEVVGGNAKTIYEGMRDHASELSGTPFVKNAPIKDSAIQLKLDHEDVYDPDYLIQRDYDEDGDLDDVAVIYVVFDYYDIGTTNLVQDYIDSYEALGLEFSLNFESDIGTMTLKDIEA